MSKAEDGKSIKMEDQANGSVIASRAPRTQRHNQRPRKSWTRWLFNNLARLSIWYAVLTILFRCPSESQSLTDENPQICRPYLIAKSHASPYIKPYYDTYADPYVQKAQPYVLQANNYVLKPATAFAMTNYQKFAEPQVEKAKAYALAQWEQSAVPQLRFAQEKASEIYEANLGPHVEKVSTAATPYYESAKENALHAHQKHVLPAIAFSQPHLHAALVNSQRFALDTALPYLKHAWTHAIIFVDGTFIPFVKALYSNNVKPQLVMIGERLSKYQQSAKLQAALDEADAEPVSDIYASSATSIAGTPVSIETTTTATQSETTTVSSSTTASSEDSKAATSQAVSEDLIKWQKKFAIAADKGADDLRERVEDIVDGMRKADISEGQGLANALEKTAQVEVDRIKAKINSLSSTMPEDASNDEIESAEEDVVQAIRDSGSKIKTRAKNLRAWTDTFKLDLEHRADLAAESTLQVLDNIRDLGLQEIGMRWAWMDGITHAHWRKYHDLRRRFDDWRSEVRDVAVNHPAVTDAQEAANRVLEEGMAVTESAARELFRLKDVAKWKIRSRDSTDVFESRAIPALAAVVSQVSSAAAGATQMIESLAADGTAAAASVVSTASEAVAEAGDKASSAVYGSDNTIELASSKVSSAARDAASSASSAVYGSTGSLESLASQASSVAVDKASSASSVASHASASVVGTGTGSVESYASEASGQASSAYSSISEAVSSNVTPSIPPSDRASSSVRSVADVVSSSASSAVSEVTNAAASEKIQNLVNEAGDNIESLTSSLINA